jgi:hypothetical protein
MGYDEVVIAGGKQLECFYSDITFQELGRFGSFEAMLSGVLEIIYVMHLRLPSGTSRTGCTLDPTAWFNLLP